MEPIPQFEKELVVNNKALIYKGVFRTEDIFHALNQAISNRGYHKREKKSEELVTETGRKIHVELRPVKHKASYVMHMIKIKINLDNVQEAVMEVNGLKRNYHQGDVEIIFDAWSMTELEDRWGMKPFVYFLKAFINKYIYIFPMESKYMDDLVTDTVYIYAHLKKLLNSYKVETGNVPVESEIRRKVEEDILKEIEKDNKEIQP